jgi:hypothetical protein
MIDDGYHNESCSCGFPITKNFYTPLSMQHIFFSAGIRKPYVFSN